MAGNMVSVDTSTPAAAAQRRYRLSEPWVLILGFCLCITIPALVQVLGIDSHATENRTLAPPPAWPRQWADSLKLPGATQSYLDDRFGLRNQLVWLNSRLRYALGVSAVSNVAIGRNGFLYNAYEPERLMEQHTGEDVFTPQQLDEWLRSIAANGAWLAAKGIAYYVVIAPDKSTIYPENLPEYPRLPHSTTRLDQVVAALAGRSDITLIDPRNAIEAEKPQYRMYTHADSHWGPRAAFITYSLLMDQIRRHFSGAVPVALGDYDLKLEPFRGDLAYLLNLYNDLIYPEDIFTFRGTSHVLGTTILAPETGWGWTVTKVRTDRLAAPKILIQGDSFTDYVMGPLFIYQTFKDPVYTHHNGTLLDKPLIEREHPDIVIEELAERYLLLH